jgi:O-antigen ligase
MIDKAIQGILISLFIFTPIAFGSMDIWAFSLMELGILLAISLYVIQVGFFPIQQQPRSAEKRTGTGSRRSSRNSVVPLILLSLFLALILFQLIPLPPGVMKILSPKAYELRQQLLSINSPLQALSVSQAPNVSSPHYPLSVFPFATQIEFFKWLTLIGFFLFLLYGRFLDHKKMNQLIVVIMLVGAGEALYGMIEFFSGHRHILYLDASTLTTSVTGTFINRNYFAGYLLMVIPLSVGFLFSRSAVQSEPLEGWRYRLSSLDGKNVLIGFGVILMILGLIFSASRMGIISLLLSFSLLGLLFRDSPKGRRFSRKSTLLLGLAVIWAGWIGLDSVISRFFVNPEGLNLRRNIWWDTFQIVKDFPIWGSGLGTFAQVFPMYRSFHIQGLITHAENDFLQFVSEAGLLAAAMLLIVLFSYSFKAVSVIRSLSPADPRRFIALGSLTGILALMFSSIVERNIQIPANALLASYLWVLIPKSSTVRIQ